MFAEQIALHHGAAAAALHRLGPGLDDVEAAIVAIPGPLDVHGPLIVALDDQRLAGQLLHLFIGQAEALPTRLVDLHGDHRATRGVCALIAGIAVDHLDRLAAQHATE